MTENIGRILFNSKRMKAFRSGNYICSECGEKMIWEDDDSDALICERCGERTDIDHYGLTEEEIKEVKKIVESGNYDPDELNMIDGFTYLD